VNHTYAYTYVFAVLITALLVDLMQHHYQGQWAFHLQSPLWLVH